MMNIDWSKAPEGYDYHLNWGEISDYVKSGFYMECGNRYVKEGGAWTDKSSINSEDHPGLVLTKRPAAAWTGEGLPPVGLKVEAYFPGDTKPAWLPTKLMYASESSIVYADGEGNREVCLTREEFNALKVSFRPVRTAEQIAAEEREAEILALSTIISGAYGDRNTAIAVLDAGYRKQEQK